MQNYSLDEKGQFIIHDYQNVRPFSSFLPGIAGPLGTPLWVFYVNRGQAITSFGVENKDHPILEFQTANRAYQVTSFLGFRTFLRIQQGNTIYIYEPFSRGNPSQNMTIGANELQLLEISPQEIQTEVAYFLLPGENISGLVRIVILTNQSAQPVNIEVLDGLPAVIPYGVDNQMLKDMGRTVEAWMEVFNLDQKVPFYRLRASVADTIEVNSFDAGNYMLSFQEGPSGSKILPVIVDPSLVFGQNTSLNEPDLFYQGGLQELLDGKQITCGRTPCGFAGSQAELEPGESIRICSIFGHVERYEDILTRIGLLSGKGYLDKKRQEANNLLNDMTDAIACSTSSPTFDAYCRQSFLDNVIRGGWPVVFENGKKKSIYYIYSRKHGDLERDYNAFSLSPEYLSHGNGNYRDIIQNRRDDVWFNPRICDFDVRTFLSLIQLDGYNPLVIMGSQFTVPFEKLKVLLLLAENQEKLMSLLSKPFSPGSLLKKIINQGIRLKVDSWTFLEKVMGESEQNVQATFGEGYWVDHWSYNLDLIDSYLAIYPDRLHDLLFLQEGLPWYDCPFTVQSRARRYVLLDGQPRQMGRPEEDHQKVKLIASRSENPNWVRESHGAGKIYRSCLFVKLFVLGLVKFATLDPWGMGVEMEAGRPGWYDAVNGLPGLFGSSMAETYALLRLIKFLLVSILGKTSGSIRLPIESMQLLHKITKALRKSYSINSNERDYRYWDTISSARESYRTSIRLGVSGDEETLSFAKLEIILEAFRGKVEAGIAKALSLNNGIPLTFFSYSVDDYEIILDNQGNQKIDVNGRPFIRVTHFTATPLPLFLEGMVRAMRTLDAGSARRLYEQVKQSSLYDHTLKMYKVK